MSDQIIIDKFSADTLRDVARMIYTVRGGDGVDVDTKPGVGITISLAAAPARTGSSSPPAFLWVKPTGKASGHGKYIGKRVLPPTTPIDPEGDLSDSEIGSPDDSAGEILIINAREVGKSTWDLWDDASGGPDNGLNATLMPRVFLATVHGISTKGKLVVLIDGLKSSDCI